LHGWCDQLDLEINPGSTYSVKVVSSYDPSFLHIWNDVLQVDVDVISTTANLNKTNYVLNNIQKYESWGYSMDDVQTAFWQLLDNPNDDGGDWAGNPQHVATIIADANANGTNYVPVLPTDVFLLFFVPVDSNGHNNAQIQFAGIQISEIYQCCDSCQVKNASVISNYLSQDILSFYINYPVSTFSLTSVVTTNNILVNCTNLTTITTLLNPIPSWCDQFSVEIDIGVSYNSRIISSFDINFDSLLDQMQVTQSNLAASASDIIKASYILNNVDEYEAEGFTVDDVQTALWQILDNPSYDGGGWAGNPQNVAAIVADADVNGILYKPILDDDIFILVWIPVDANGNNNDQIQLSAIPLGLVYACANCL
jgi:hypothetical protein